MKSLLNLFRPTEKERAIERELSGTTTPKPKANPPKRGGTSSTLPEAGADELHQLRARLQAVTSERDSIQEEFSQYRIASQSDQRELEAKNQRLQTSLNEVSQALSQQIASSGLSAPVPEATGAELEVRGLQRSIAAAKAEANRTHSQKPLTRPVI